MASYRVSLLNVGRQLLSRGSLSRPPVVATSLARRLPPTGICRLHLLPRSQLMMNAVGQRQMAALTANKKSDTRHRLTFSRLLHQIPRPYVDPKLSYAFGKSNGHLIYSTVSRELERCALDKPDDIAYISMFENIEATFKQVQQDVNKLAKSLVKDFNVCKGDFVGVFAYNCYNWLVLQFACSKVGAVLSPINPSYKSEELRYVLTKGGVKCLFMPGPKSEQFTLNDHIIQLQSEEIVSSARLGDIKLEHVIFMDRNTEYITQDPAQGASSTPTSNSNDSLYIDNKLPSKWQFHNWSETQNDGIVFNTIQEALDAGVAEKDSCVINPDDVQPEDLFAVYYTSGTTGKPKGACISQFTAINNSHLTQIRVRQGRPNQTHLMVATVLPMFHIFAGVLNALGPITNNTTLIFPLYKYDIEAFVKCICKYNVNFVTLTPTMLIDMLTHIEENKLTDLPLRIVQVGGASLAPEVATRTKKILPLLEDLRIGYGSTENGSVATVQTLLEPQETSSKTVGPPLDFTEIRIVNPGTEEVLPLGQLGEIQTRGFNTMVEYLNEPEKTAEVVTNNRWYKTGDLGFMHPHGSIQISSRLKQLIIKGGENIYPEEVEQLIHKLSFVEDVHVVGVPDERYGEQVCAWVKLKASYRETKTKEARQDPEHEIHQDDIIEFCKKNITYFKVPRYLLFVDEFPMTPTKKVQHHIMTQISTQKLGLKQC